MSYIPDQGDIITLDFDPSAGREIIKRRPALVISRRHFNQHTGFAIVAPITSTIRGIKLELVLAEGMKTRGSVLLYQVKSVDYGARNATFVESLPASLAQQAIDIIQVITR